MAAIGPVLLEIENIPNNLDADVKVHYTVTFDASDVNTNRTYAETIELIGVDNGFLNQRDEVIRFGIGEVPFLTGNAVKADGRATATFLRSKRVQRRELNEDKPGKDEVRAQVILKSGSRVAERDSNTVQGDFNPAHV
jgi:hypothetical protein